jgi:hypothetical protein
MREYIVAAELLPRKKSDYLKATFPMRWRYAASGCLIYLHDVLRQPAQFARTEIQEHSD